MQDLFSESFRQMLDKHCNPRHVRDIEGGAPASMLWQTLEESGFPDALLPEARGGHGLRLRDVFPILLASGGHALPVPLAHTMVLRAICSAAGQTPPAGSITLACTFEQADDAIRCSAVPYGKMADWVVVGLEEGGWLLDGRQAERHPTGVYGSLEADLVWPSDGAARVDIAARADWRAIGAAIHATQMAGAMERVLRTTVAYANEREQFGRAIGRFQAIQQQLSLMAEEVAASRMAAEIGCASASHTPDPVLAAIAKSRTSEAAWTVASIAHAVHGAIGITEEYDLQLQTRRLHEWRLAYGSESYWNSEIGRLLLSTSDATTLEFIRERVFPWEEQQDLRSALFEAAQ